MTALNSGWNTQIAIYGTRAILTPILQQTISFIEETNPEYVNVSGFCPVVGSEIYNNYQDYGIRYIDKDWSKQAHLMNRFKNKEDFGLPFEYEEINKWGKTFTREQIQNNILELQQYLKDRKMVY